MSRVCAECEVRANRAFWLTLLLIIGVPLLAAIPAILFYGDASHKSTVFV